MLSKLASAVSPKSLKVISFADVQKHDSIDKGIWVTYRDGVYDITKFLSGNFCDAMIQMPLHPKHPRPKTRFIVTALKLHRRFVQNHPGGLERILKAAGGQWLGLVQRFRLQASL